jgi:hypothetical protein
MLQSYHYIPQWSSSGGQHVDTLVHSQVRQLGLGSRLIPGFTEPTRVRAMDALRSHHVRQQPPPLDAGVAMAACPWQR